MHVSRSHLASCWLLVSLIGLAARAQQAVELPKQQQISSDPIGQQQQQQQTAPVPTVQGAQIGALSAGALQAHLNQMQQQAQRQLGQLNGLVLNAVNGTKYSNVLEAISNVGKAIHQQIAQATNPNHVNIITGSNLADELANNKKNEYQSIVITDQGSSPQPQTNAGAFNLQANSSMTSANYREQGEILRHEIKRRASQLQQVVASSTDLLKNNGDLIVRRLLQQMNIRLDQAKAKADRIINEPTTNEVALRALGTINLGLNNLNTIIANIVNRLEQASKEAANGGNQQQQQVANNQIASGMAPLNQIQQRLQSAILKSRTSN